MNRDRQIDPAGEYWDKKDREMTTKDARREKMREILDKYYQDREYAENHYSAGDSPFTIVQTRDTAITAIEALMPKEVIKVCPAIPKDKFYLMSKEQAEKMCGECFLNQPQELSVEEIDDKIQ